MRDFLATFAPLRIALAFLAALTVGNAAAAGPMRIAVIYAETEIAIGDHESGILGGLEGIPGVEVLRVNLDAVPTVVGRLLLAAGSGGPVRLANAGGSVGAIAVIYPDIGEPYRSVFSKIIEGIEDRTRARVAAFAVGNNANIQELSGELRKQDVRVVIALGRHGLKAAAALDKDIGVVTGGVISVPEGEARSGPILSLSPDPSLLFDRLKLISPETRRIVAIYEPRQNAWLIRLARDAAKSAGYEFVAHEAADLKTATRLYQEFFATADGKRDALWLLQDSTTADEATILPMVLQESWSRHIPVFSSAVSHVRRGALFALYPNNVELGRSLAASALNVAGGNAAPRGPLPLREVLTAFNTRTASHLGLTRYAVPLPAFDLTFPEQ